MTKNRNTGSFLKGVSFIHFGPGFQGNEIALSHFGLLCGENIRVCNLKFKGSFAFIF